MFEGAQFVFFMKEHKIDYGSIDKRPGDLSGYFNDVMVKEIAETGISKYPDLPYHNPQHGRDVVAATYGILNFYNDTFSDRDRELLLLAASWHDAGFGDDESMWRPHRSKEAYAAHLLKEVTSGEFAEQDVIFMQRAILGTMMTSKRATPEARLLHLADLSYLWGDWEMFLDGAMRYREEELPGVSLGDFISLEKSFLLNHSLNVQTYLRKDGVDRQVIDGVVDRIWQNADRLSRISLEDISLQMSGLALSLLECACDR